MVGSILGMLAFLLAVTMGMASDRFDARRVLVRDEAKLDPARTYFTPRFLAMPSRKDSPDTSARIRALRIRVGLIVYEHASL